MMRYSAETISKIKRLREEGATLTEIIVATGIPKTSIFEYIKDIPKSDYLRQKLAEIRAITHRTLIDRRRGKPRNKWYFTKPASWSPLFVNLIAHFMFDGTMARTSFMYNNRSVALIRQVTDAMEVLLNVFDFRSYEDKRSGVIKILYGNVELATYLNIKVVELLDYIPSASLEEKIAFLRAFYDDEGNVTFKGTKKAVRGYQHAVPILELVQKLLGELGIYSRVVPKFYEIVISCKVDIIRFAEIINFSAGLCVDGERSNSIWKESLEKREILRRLIADYQPC